MKAYLSVTEIARVMEKERSTIVRWIKAGKFGKARRVGNEYRVSHESFRKWWYENQRGTKVNKKRS